MHLHEINLQPAAGGGEVFTRALTRALADAGAEVTLYVNSSNRFWDLLKVPRVDVVPVPDWRRIDERLPPSGATLLTQSRVPDEMAERWSRTHMLAGFAHMPILGRSASEFARYACVFTVSQYCVDLLRKAGISQVYPEPIYGTCEIDPVFTGQVEVRARSPYHWDGRKGRDRLFALLEPVARMARTPPIFSKRPGLTLGIVSLLSPIKQFPTLFELIAPKIAATPDVNLEIFGNGGYAQVRDLRKALAPMIERTRFWGYQQAVSKIYPSLDYLMTGLPEKEALGLNVLEAQAAGTPVLAPEAPPFIETIVDGKGGFLYPDPRVDRGAGFESLLCEIAAGKPRPDPRADKPHLEKFSYSAMVERASRMIDHLRRASAVPGTA